MIKKRMILTGVIEVGDYIRLILFPDEPIKEKRKFDLFLIAETGDPSEINKQAIIKSIIANQPPTIYISKQEFDKDGYKLDDHIIVSIEQE
jgi:hypothetical protein